MEQKKNFRWLHFSDLHVGMKGLDQLWARFGTVLADDLKITHRRTGGIDLVIFSGDLVQKGSAEEFAQFDSIMDRILDQLRQLGSDPKIVTVPGNHDLSRPNSLAPEAVALAQFWHNRELRDQFWNTEAEAYRSFVAKSFVNYLNWRDHAIERGIHLTPQLSGLLPGDASYYLDAEAGRIGIVGLNSSWLQLGAGDYERRLHVDVEQLLAITGRQPDKWVMQNEVNLLVTHHPQHWLHAHEIASWNNDINPEGRFDLHLFGHMHTPDTSTTSHGGSLSRRHVQAASLFGLEELSDGTQRIQGYSLNEIRVGGADRVLVSWPRLLTLLAGGRYKLVPDTSQDLDDETASFSLSYRVDRQSVSVSNQLTLSQSQSQSQAASARLSPSNFDLTAVQYSVGNSKAHQKVRKIEQQNCINALSDKRAVWITSDWGMGKDGFVATLRDHFGVQNEKVYRIDASGYRDRDSFSDGLEARFGASFQQICNAVADSGRSILVLDDVDVITSPIGTEAAIETLVAPVSDFASETYIFISSRRRPRSVKLPIIELRALDEADVAIYAREMGGEQYFKADVVSKLFRHTDGVPTRIDDALRDLEITSLDDLISSNPDFGEADTHAVTAPPALISTVRELKQSDEKAEKRAYELLLALSALPQGEQLSRIKRFFGTHPFHAAHARTLLERSLIDTVTLAALDGMPNDNTAKALIVPRPVREYVRSIIDEETSKSIDRKALELYFGDNWTTGNIRNSPTGKRVRSALCAGNEIQNACTLILRAVRRTLADGVELEAKRAVRLALAFTVELQNGDHFRSAAAFCEDIINLLEESGGFVKERSLFRYRFGRSLRMVSRHDEAIAELEQVDHNALTKLQRQSAELQMALLLKSSGDHRGSAEAAKRVISLNPQASAALQARTILAEQIEQDEQREAELKRLLEEAKKRDLTTICSNLMITLANERRCSDDDAKDMLVEITKNSKSKQDFYNSVRAIVELAKHADSASDLTEDQKGMLIDAYYFLFNERLYSLFDSCHDALWRIFERNGETENLLNLFRHSSFIWRLNGRSEQEAKYLSKLLKEVQHLIEQGISAATRDGAYFLVRVSVVMDDLPRVARSVL